MAHYAQINSNNTVIQVLTVDNSIIDAATFLSELLGGTWIQTSYNTKGGIHYGPDGQPDGEPQIGYNYAAINYLYDINANAFYAPQFYPSWVLNTNSYIWEAPTPPGPAPEAIYPNYYTWDESTLSWILNTLPTT